MLKVCTKNFKLNFRLLSFLIYLLFTSSNIISEELSQEEHHTKINNPIIKELYKEVPEKILNNEDIIQLRKSDPNKIQVIMFFSYACHWCYSIEESFKTWKKQQENKPVVVYKLPVAFSKLWDALAKMYLSVNILDTSGKLDSLIFKKIQEDREPLWLPNKFNTFLEQNNFSIEKYEKIQNSFSVKRKQKQSQDLAKAFHIEATPIIYVLGPKNCYFTDLTFTENQELLFKTVNNLIEQESKNLKN